VLFGDTISKFPCKVVNHEIAIFQVFVLSPNIKLQTQHFNPRYRNLFKELWLAKVKLKTIKNQPYLN